MRYHRILPLAVIKRHRCVVLGASRNALTVGIIEGSHQALLDYLQILTGATLFPVLIDPKQMRLLITRIERYQHFRSLSCQSYALLQLPSQIRLILNFKRRKEG